MAGIGEKAEQTVSHGVLTGSLGRVQEDAKSGSGYFAK
jgi:hypothetical protein